MLIFTFHLEWLPIQNHEPCKTHFEQTQPLSRSKPEHVIRLMLIRALKQIKVRLSSIKELIKYTIYFLIATDILPIFLNNLYI